MIYRVGHKITVRLATGDFGVVNGTVIPFPGWLLIHEGRRSHSCPDGIDAVSRETTL
jgi:hypothetical protein